ncbi:cellulose binding domain-containing protein [Tautonia sociabilis]|uniref:cellulose binding domain-containing protein n=1 Tax=Tautonia sociabilis TaxID=2080755 RepID=UPI00131562E3|nr:cellulose binding domain-containing protein [Tautonia sociabilis]
MAFAIDSDWGSGFTASVTVTNHSERAVEDWRLGFELDTRIGSIWDATIVSDAAGRFEVEGASWNRDLAAGGTVSFGFVGGAGGREPSGFSLNGVPLDGSPGAPALRIRDASASEGNVGPSAIAFAVELSKAAEVPVTVGYATVDGTATVGFDYERTVGTLTFAPGETTAMITVPVVADTVAEPDETFTVTLFDATGARIAVGSAKGTIRNDDGPAPVDSAPAVPSLFIQDADPSDGRFTVGFTIWSGTNASRWELLENGKVVHAADLVDRSPASQSASVELTGRFYAANTYQVVVSNAAGSTAGAEQVHVVGGASRITLPGVDGREQAAQVTISPGTTSFDLRSLGVSGSSYRVGTNNPDVVSPSVSGSTLVLEGLGAGRASVRIEDAGTGEERFLGVRVRDAEGALPGMPPYVAMGSVSEDSAADLGFWRDFDEPETNKRMDVRYIYLNGGPENGWRSWQNGNRLQSFLRESLKLGMTPYFVWYNIPDSVESYATNLNHIQDYNYMKGYFADLAYALDVIREMAPDETVGFVLEPDFLGYLMQIGRRPASEVMARVDAAYDAGALEAGVDPSFDNSVAGLVGAINATIAKHAPNVRFGWQFNLWASPGITTSIPSTGLIRLTDTLGLEAGRSAIAAEAAEIARYYIDAGVLSHGADFVSIDKYGLDAVGYQPGAAQDPAGSTWFWNADHWQNYLLFTRTLHDETGLPVTLWQIPVGHINSSLATNPYDPSGRFPDLSNTVTRYEDSAGTFFLGDTFRTTGARQEYFSMNGTGLSDVSVSGDTITWGSHVGDAAAAGVDAILFGAGVGASTDGVGAPPTDGSWWISKVQEYFEAPVPLGSGGNEALPPSIRVGDVVVDETSGEAMLTVSLSRPSDRVISVDYQTADGTATAGQDYRASGGTLSIPAGARSGSIAIPLLDDLDVEADERFRVLWTNPQGGSLADAETSVTIRDDDAPASPVGIVFQVDDDWGSGFTGSIAIRNTSASPIQGWELSFTFEGRITSIWNAEIVEHVGNRYRIRSRSWNSDIASGGEVSFGFVGSRTSPTITPTDFVLASA